MTNLHDQKLQHPPVTTDDNGVPAASDEFSLSVGAGGPLLLQDHYLLQKMAHFNRERVPERVVHAKGSGAFGYFEATTDASQWTKAAFLNKAGKRTPVLARFSTVAGESGSADTARDPRGFALKFYTEEGNYDLVGNNTPIFFIRDPSKFSDFIHSQKRLPDSGLRDNTMQWDFWSLSPEVMHQVTFLMTDRGTPRTWRHMHGFGSHTFLWVNAGGERFWVKYHFKTEQGIENFTNDEAMAMSAEDPDYHRRDLRQAIEQGNYPVWRLEMQIMPYADAPGYRFNPFDLTKVWPHADYPPTTIGRLVLDRNPDNFFAQIEQAAFEPSSMVPGIGPSPDKMLLGRLFSYPDTHRYRIGPNYLQLPVNRPLSAVHSYNVDGPMAYIHAGTQPVYAPNSMGGPQADPDRYSDPGWLVEAGEMVRAGYEQHAEDDDFSQAGAMVRRVLSPSEREHLAANIAGHMRQVTSQPIKERALALWQKVDGNLAASIATSLGMEVEARAAAGTAG